MRLPVAHDPDLKSIGLRFRTPGLILALAIVLVTAAAIPAGYYFKANQELRAAAIALTGGNPDRAPQIMMRYGCAGCHTIPGVKRANGLVGPALTDVRRRMYIAGVLENTPENLIRWIVDPQAVDPGTAMPVTGITPEEARHVAAYLYALR